MKINQLFSSTVDVGILHELCRCLGLDGADDGRWWTRDDLVRQGACDRVKAMPWWPDLKDAYIPCKRRLYVEPFEHGPFVPGHSYKNPEHRLLVILRQLLRLYGRRLVATEHNRGCKKVMWYRIAGPDGGGNVRVSFGTFLVAMS
jgi:hypothetical protein